LGGGGIHGHDRMVGKVYSLKNNVKKFCQSLAAGQWFSPGIPVSSTNKTDHHNITEILLKVALNTITLTLLYKLVHIIL
jgi:hypothetical protein